MLNMTVMRRRRTLLILLLMFVGALYVWRWQSTFHCVPGFTIGKGGSCTPKKFTKELSKPHKQVSKPSTKSGLHAAPVHHPAKQKPHDNATQPRQQHTAVKTTAKETHHPATTETHIYTSTPPLPTADRIVNLAKSVVASSNEPLLLTIINKGYLNMTYNWLCHTSELEGVHKNIVFLVQGEDTERELKSKWPDVKTITVHESEDELKNVLHFGTVGYVRMMVRRTDLLNALIQANLSIVLFETDFIWFENPVPDFIEQGKTQGLDLVGTVSTADTQIMCGAFIYFRNTRRMRQLWGEVTRQMHALEERMKKLKDTARAPWRQNEQVFLNLLLEKRYVGAKYGLVNYTLVVDGRWYGMKSANRAAMKPKAIHNNFLQSTEQKIQRFQRFGQWVLTSNQTCNMMKVRKLLRKKK